MININNCKFPLILLVGSVVLIRIIRYLNEKETFNKINLNYRNLNFNDKTMINQLKIYPDNLSRSFTEKKKNRVVLIVGGFRDTPKLWSKLEEYLQKSNIDYVIPRLMGFGRTYFQFNVNWQDWVISVMDELSILQNLYEQVDILGFSTGCNIGLYVSQFKWNCKINNIILSSPNFIPSPSDRIFKLILRSFILSNFFMNVYPVCHRPYEGRIKKDKFREENNKDNKFRERAESCPKTNIFFEKNFPLYSAVQMWIFQDILPKKINCNKIVIVKPNNDKIIGDIEEQKRLLIEKYNKPTNLINIPSNPNLNVKVGHNILNASDNILEDYYNQIYHHLKN